MLDNINKSIDSYNNSDYEKFKSYDRFDFLIREMSDSLKSASNCLDIGCAKGELIYILKEKYPKITYVGLEYSKELIDIAQKESFLKDVVFIEGDAQKFKLNEKFDIVVMSGVLSIFDEVQNILDNMLDHINSGGKGYIFGGFNIDDIDVIVRYRNNYINSDIWESGWNIFSIPSIEKVLAPHISSFHYKKFNLSQNIEKKDNPVSSYTVNTVNKDKIILTGGGIVRDFYLLSFTKK